jgi:iron complex transport system substrate-binding protein
MGPHVSRSVNSRRAPRHSIPRVLAAGAALVALAVSAVPALTPTAAAAAGNPSGCVHGYKSGVDYFPDKASVSDAQNLAISYHGSYKVLTVKVPFPGGAPQTYVLVECGTPAPKLTGDLAGAQVVTIPVHSIFAESTTELLPIVDVGETQAIHGIGSEQYVNSTAVRALFAKPGFVEFAKSGDVDVERVLGAKPDVVLTAGTDSPAYAKLREAGVPVVAVAEYLEATPLGQAEWAKLEAALFNREARAQATYADVARRYHQLAGASTATSASPRPLVMAGFQDSGTFYEYGGHSITARLVGDAGGTSVWADNTDTGPLMIDLETELARAAHANVWINGSQFWTSRADITKDDPRYASFRPFQLGQVWVPNKRKNTNGGLDYFELGVARPDLVLADLIKVFHPAAARDHQFVFYVRLPPR